MNITFIRPLDQPLGRVRLLAQLQEDLSRDGFRELRMIVAFAKLGPLVKLGKTLVDWRRAGRTIDVVFGVDQQGTSREALDFALRTFDSVRVAHTADFRSTFHPKVYLFVGENEAKAYIGSNNLTVGGTETNSEAAIVLTLNLHTDKPLLDELMSWWHEAEESSARLTSGLLAELEATGLVTTERQQRTTRVGGTGGSVREPSAKLPFPRLAVKPPSPLPKALLAGGRTRTDIKVAPQTVADTARALVIQIIPHHNGEVFLSTNAVRQNPRFFGYPFTGKTTPKKKGNPTYPQRAPDPVVDLEVYDTRGQLAVELRDFRLNTVYYERKGEIRITVRPEVVAATPEYSILVMENATEDRVDYRMQIHPPGSQRYKDLLAVCDQEMPTGGKGRSRRFGWL